AGIYLGVIPISRMNGSLAFDPEKQGTVVEYAVYMRKLDERYLLSERAENESLSTEHLDPVADKLAEFYGNQQPGPDILEWGRTERIKTNTDENFQQTEAFIGRTIGRSAYETIRHYTDGYLERNAALFQERIEEQ